MADLVVTCPMGLWTDWIAEGDAAGEPYTGEEWAWFGAGKIPPIGPGDRLYVVAHNRLRGWSPVTRFEITGMRPRQCSWGRDVATWAICRRGDAVACTLAQPIRGFQSWRRRWWEREAELPFPDWKTP